MGIMGFWHRRRCLVHKGRVPVGTTSRGGFTSWRQVRTRHREAGHAGGRRHLDPRILSPPCDRPPSSLAQQYCCQTRLGPKLFREFFSLLYKMLLVSPGEITATVINYILGTWACFFSLPFDASTFLDEEV